MSRRSPFPVMIAMSALLATPGLAQTMNSSSTPPNSAASNSTASTSTSPATTPPMAGSSSTANSSGSSTYFTADQQIRASKLIGSSVYNDQKEKIGSVDELLLDQNHDVTSVVLSVGGFLGMGSKLVKVPYDELHVMGGQIVIPGATKEQLTQMPDYKFASST